ncbi:hypothetical protein JTE90_017239 [Oedothorax gibbosus]|uniref:Inositol-1-monophosphatase n=1 Tax=Oedothorax gibbosus TaxID=931172 RepID=A0AAV6VFG4_9ARAC|nr:hypothetical protein JTE90_017239 [Oedothorax gibbosus]
MSAVDIDECCNVAVEVAKAAGKDIRKAFYESKTVQIKMSNVDLVTETDKKVEDFLKSTLLSTFPGHCFIGEESTFNKLTDTPTWIIDPVDGTMNFVHSFPHSCISIGLAVNKQIVLGVVYNPILDQMYTGVKGKGAFCNGQKLKVSGVQNLSGALVIAECGSTRTKDNMDQMFTNFRRVTEKAHGLRMIGSAALNMCMIASGGADAYFEYTLHCWDMAAGKIIVEEAGGVVIDPEGGELDLMSRRLICASSQHLAMSLSTLLQHSQHPRDE